MGRREICGGGAKPARRFSFSWADEVEREEAAAQQQQQHEEEEDDENQPPPPRRGGETEEQTTKANPFGAARPREVVLAEKGVDWRARDRDFDDASRRASAARSRSRAARRHEDSTPATSTRRKSSAPPVRYGSAWGGKRKCAGQDEPSSRQVRPVADHGRRVFGQLNIGEEGEFSRWSCSASRGSVCAEGIGAGKAEIVDDEIADRCTVPVPAGTETGGCGAGRRRRKRGGRKMRSNKAK